MQKLVVLFFIAFNFITLNSSSFAKSPIHPSVQTHNQVLGIFCHKMNQRFKKYGWNRIICNPKTWTWEPEYITHEKNPLLYKVFKFHPSKSTTLIMCGVHGDEMPTVYQCIHLVRDIIFDNPDAYRESTIVVAPIINPDGFLKRKPTRQSGRGVDLNRNFPTRDFEKKALKSWKKRYRSSKRKYPGPYGGSEIETKFQMMLIEKFRPDKIISLHSPYGWLDVDLPPEEVTYQIKDFLSKAKEISKTMSKKSNNYPVTNFRFYPGSLGNYAANERKIPTYTLELPTSSFRKAHSYWLRMRSAIVAAITYVINVAQTTPPEKGPVSKSL